MSTRLFSLALAVSLPTTASAVMFDPDGMGSASAVEIAGFDWNNSSFLAKGGGTAIATWLATGGAAPAAALSFDVYTHAAVAALQGPGGRAISTPGLNDLYEVTMIAGFGETVVFADSRGSAEFELTPGGLLTNGSKPFLEIYYSPVNSDQLSGSGFGDGTLLLKAGLVSEPSAGFFERTARRGAPSAVLMDQAGADNWDGFSSITGIGSQDTIVLGDISFINTDFFKLGTGESLNISFSNFSISLPFNSTNPSDCFNLVGVLCSADAPSDVRLEAGDGPLIPNLGFGEVNGTGPDFIAQTDFNSPLSVVAAPVPAPAAAWLLASALAGVAGIARRRV